MAVKEYNMFRLRVLLLLSCINVALLQGIESGTNGKLRLCFVKNKEIPDRSQRYCPVLDQAWDSEVECVLAVDRVDCLRRISEGTVDFGVFNPEDLLVPQWADMDVLVTNEMRHNFERQSRAFAASIVAVVKRRILPDSTSTIHAVLRNSILCYPDLDDTISGYLESLVVERSCDPCMSLAENRIKALSVFFGKACRAGGWVYHSESNDELKKKYSSLCTACRDDCSTLDRYWRYDGGLRCMIDGAGDVTWGDYDDVRGYFGLNKQPGNTDSYPPIEAFAFLCRDGTWQPLDVEEPCVWLHRPWDVIVAKRESANAVSNLTQKLDLSPKTDDHWPAALVVLLGIYGQRLSTLTPPAKPVDYLSRAEGFREAYNQSSCDPPRYIKFCTTSLMENNKCEWLSEAGAVYGVFPTLKCVMRNNTEECMKAVANKEVDVAVGDSDWIVKGSRDYGITPILHELTSFVEETSLVVACVRQGANITKPADLRGKQTLFGGEAWDNVLSYFTEDRITCREFSKYFKEICAPGVERKLANATDCYEDGPGEVEALNSLLAGKSDMAFVSMATYKMIAANQSSNITLQEIIPLCPEENQETRWTAIGHVFASKNITSKRHQEIVNALENFHQLFKSNVRPMIKMYGSFDHKSNVLFHTNTIWLTPENIYVNKPLNFEHKFSITDVLCSFGEKTIPSIFLLVVNLFVTIRF